MPEWILRFPDLPADEANVLAQELRQAIREAEPTISVELRRESTTSMDFGTSLALVLGAPAAAGLAKAVIAWAKRNRGKIRLYRPDGVLEAEGLESKDVAALVKAFSGKP